MATTAFTAHLLPPMHAPTVRFLYSFPALEPETAKKEKKFQLTKDSQRIHASHDRDHTRMESLPANLVQKTLQQLQTLERCALQPQTAGCVAEPEKLRCEAFLQSGRLSSHQPSSDFEQSQTGQVEHFRADGTPRRLAGPSTIDRRSQN